MTHDLYELARSLRAEDADRVAELFPASRRAELREQITSRERSNIGESARREPPRSRLNWRRPPIPRRARRRSRVWALGATAVAAVAVVLAATSTLAPVTTARAVSFRTAADSEIIATITDPFAAESTLKAAFAQHDLNITVNLLPVSPSLVGTVIYISDNGGPNAIQALQGGHCISPDGTQCSIGLRIPTTFSGQGYVTLGRPAKPGETYQSQNSAFAPGESLHCSGLLGAQVSRALPTLQADHLTVTWRGAGAASGSNVGDTAPPPTNYIWSANMTAPGAVEIFTAAQQWPADTAHGAAVNNGC